METPLQRKGYREYLAVVDTRYLPDELSEWMDINARHPKLTGAVPNAIRGGFHDEPDMFVFMNRGLVIAADKVAYDNKSSTVSFELANPKLHGLLDGGHTYTIVKAEEDGLNGEGEAQSRYVRVEFLEGFGHDDIIDIVGARNTSNQVKDPSLMNLEGQFQFLRLALKGTAYLEKIVFKENDTDSEGDSQADRCPGGNRNPNSIRQARIRGQQPPDNGIRFEEAMPGPLQGRS